MDQQDLASFFAPADTSPLRVVDRSTLEWYATCPQMGRLLESGSVLNESALSAAGEEVHAAFSRTITEYIDSGGVLSKRELQESAEQNLFGARPDVQPEAIRAARRSLWTWSEYIAGQHADNILRYDGGEGDRSGQLAKDLGDLELRVTSELDLLCSTPSVEVVELTDYKSGHKWWTEHDVADSFQFGLHACLVWEAYPNVRCVRVRVWSTRVNALTHAVEFLRSRERQLWARVRAAAGLYAQHSGGSEAPTWPSVDKCPTCYAAASCPASKNIGELAANPEGFLDSMVAVQAKLDAMQEQAKAYSDAHGTIVGNGVCFGRDKPKTERKPTAQLYALKG